MNGVTKNALTRLREAAVIKLRAKGYTERRIAEELATPQFSDLRNADGSVIQQPAVHKIIKRVEARLLAQTTMDMEALKRRHTAMLEQNIEDLRDAFEKSKQAQVYQKTKHSGPKPGAKKNEGPFGFEQTEVGQKSLVGDHTILRELRETAGDIRDIWGANAPVKTDTTIHGEMQVSGDDLSALTDDELRQLQTLQLKIAKASQAKHTGSGSA